MTEISRTVSTAMANLRQRQTATEISRQIQDRSQEATTGLLANPYAALGARASDAIAIRMQIERNDGFLVQNRLLEGRMAQIDQALGSVREAGQGVLDIAAGSLNSAGATATTLGAIARDAIASIVSATAVHQNGTYSLSGTASEVPPLRNWDNAGGMGPRAIVDGVTNGAVTDLTDANDKIAQLKAIFNGDPSAPAGSSFEDAFYNGASGPDGVVSNRVSETEQIDQPIRADDPAMRDLLRGLAMLDSVDVSQITDPAAYDAWMGEAVAAISSGLGGVQDLQIDNGLQRARLSDTVDAQNAKSSFLNSERLELEGVDQYDAAVRLTLLQSQLEANYAVTARLARMSFLNFL